MYGAVMALNFTQATPKKSYEHVVEQIEEAIFNGSIKAGDRLPPEMQLKETFNTSRGTIREALLVLENKGLVAIRAGVKGGAEVQPANTRAMQDSIAVMIRHQQCSLEHLAEFRAFLEGYAARKAASNVTADQMKELDTIMADIEAHAATNPDNFDEFHRLDALFHQQIALMADNPLLLANQTCIHENIHVYFQTFLPFSNTLLTEDVNDLKAIHRAVTQKEPKEAEAAARQHVLKFSKLMEGQRA